MNVFYRSLKEYETCAFRYKKVFLENHRPAGFQDRRFLCETVARRFMLHWASRQFSAAIDSKWALARYNEEIGSRDIVGHYHSDLELIRKRIVNQSNRIIETVRHHGLDQSHHFLVDKQFKKQLGKSAHYMMGNITLVENTGKWIVEADFSDDPDKLEHDLLIFSGLLISLVTKKMPSRLSLMLPSAPKLENRLTDIAFEKRDFEGMYDRIKVFVKNCVGDCFPANGAWAECRYCGVKKECDRYSKHARAS